MKTAANKTLRMVLLVGVGLCVSSLPAKNPGYIIAPGPDDWTAQPLATKEVQRVPVATTATGGLTDKQLFGSEQSAPTWNKGPDWGPEELPGKKRTSPKPSKKWNPLWKKQTDPITKLFRKYDDKFALKVLDNCRENLDLTLRYSKVAQKRRDFLKSEWAKKEYLNERYEWQRRDRREKQKKRINKMKRRAALDMTSRLVKVIRDLDRIENREIKRSPEFVEVKSQVYREYLKAQMYLHNFGQSIPILERYISLSHDNYKDITAHRFLVTCYAHHLRQALKSNGDPRRSRFFQEKKHEHMLLYASFRYGKNSEQYREVLEKIEREKMNSGLF